MVPEAASARPRPVGPAELLGGACRSAVPFLLLLAGVGAAVEEAVIGDPEAVGAVQDPAYLTAAPTRTSVRGGKLRRGRLHRLIRAVSTPGRLRSGAGPAILRGGRYWVRTSDLFGVNEALYH